jgi:RNA polymerase sigma-70 factor (ECF subfamily)
VLDPDVVLRSDGGPSRPSLAAIIRGPEAVASSAMAFRHLASTATRRLVNGGPGGVTWTPDGRPIAVLAFTVAAGRIVAIDVLADPDRLARLGLTRLPSQPSVR